MPRIGADRQVQQRSMAAGITSTTRPGSSIRVA
jgi:hypothetical protein